MNLNKITVGALLAMLASIAAILTQIEKISAWMPPSKSDLEAMESRILETMQRGQAADAAKRRALGWYIGRNWETHLLERKKPTDEAALHRHNRELSRIQNLMDKLEDEKAVRTFIDEFRR